LGPSLSITFQNLPEHSDAQSTDTGRSMVSPSLTNESEINLDQTSFFYATASGDQTYEAIDSHMHMDRTSRSLKRSVPLRTLEEVKSLIQPLRPKIRVDLKGVVAVYCDPDTYPINVPTSEGVKVAVGFHPKKAKLFDVTRERLFSSLVLSPDVAALGEVGFDLTEPRDTWDRQLEVLRKVLSWCSVSKPLILHIRGSHWETFNPYLRVFELVKGFCGKLQPIHLHCFGGSVADVQGWAEFFENCYFGFTGSVKHFSADQLEGLKCVPLSRILLETDSPYLVPDSRLAVNTPAYLGDVGRLVAQRKEVELPVLMRHALNNTRKLYKFD